MKFFILNSGDNSVGLPGFDIDIVLTGNTEVFDDGFTQRFKEFLRAELDGLDGATDIMTEKEHSAFLSFDEASLGDDSTDERHDQRGRDLMAYSREWK